MKKQYLFLFSLLGLLSKTTTYSSSEAAQSPQKVEKIKFKIQMQEKTVKVTVAATEINLKFATALMLKKQILQRGFSSASDEDVKKSGAAFFMGEKEWKNEETLADVRESLAANQFMVQSKNAPKTSLFGHIIITKNGMMNSNFDDKSDDESKEIDPSKLTWG